MSDMATITTAQINKIASLVADIVGGSAGVPFAVTAASQAGWVSVVIGQRSFVLNPNGEVVDA